MSVTWVACRSGMRGVLQEHWRLPKWFYQWRRPLTLPEMVNCLSFLRDVWGLFIPFQSMMECWWPRLMQTVTASVSSRVKDIAQNSSLNFWSSCLHPPVAGFTGMCHPHPICTPTPDLPCYLLWCLFCSQENFRNFIRVITWHSSDSFFMQTSTDVDFPLRNPFAVP